jgi:hypothetical protein
MSDPQAIAEKLKSIGLFDLQPTLPGLLKAIAEYLERHRVSQPEDVSWRHDSSRGWQARIRLSPTDFLAVMAQHVMPVRLKPFGDGASVELETDLRAGVISAVVALDQLEGTMTPQGLLLRPIAPTTPPSAGGVGVRFR